MMMNKLYITNVCYNCVQKNKKTFLTLHQLNNVFFLYVKYITDSV